MHKFLKAIGFHDIKTRKELNELLAFCVKNADEKQYISGEDTDSVFAEYSKSFGENIGITVRGMYDDKNCFTMDYFYPYAKGICISSYEDITIERHAEKESYAGICDDVKVGV